MYFLSMMLGASWFPGSFPRKEIPLGAWSRDLGPRERIRLALEGIEVKGYYGAITDLAREYRVSRWFVYHLIHLLVSVWLEFSQPTVPGPKGKSTVIVVDQNRLDRGIVPLCLAGCSLEGIQVCLEELLDTRRSIGYISQVLQCAQHEAAGVNRGLRYDTEGVGLLDELFYHQKPILTILEPESTARSFRWRTLGMAPPGGCGSWKWKTRDFTSRRWGRMPPKAFALG